MDSKNYILAGFLFFYLQCFAQNKLGDTIVKSTPLNEVVISAMHINDSLLNAPAAIGIVSKKDLQRNNLTDISTAINLIPGVYMQSSNITTNRISIRGIGARTPFGTNKIRAFYGSIPLTSGDGETTIEDIDIANIEQVEIIKGPLSSVYGAGLGGAILISPKLAEGNGNHFQISSVHGSYGLLKNTIDYSLNKKSASLNISYHNLETDGWRDNSAYKREGMTISGELFRKNDRKLTYFGNFTDLKAFIASSIDKKTFDENPKAAAPTWMASKGFKEYQSVLGGLSYDWKLFHKVKNSTSIFINYKDNYESRPFDILRQYSFAAGVRKQFSGNLNFGKIKSTYNAGFEYFKDDYHGRTLENLYKQNNGLGSREGDQVTGTIQNRSFYNAFAQLRLLLSAKMEFQAGLNCNKTRFELNNNFPSDNDRQEDYSYDAIWSPQVSFLFKPTSSQTIYLSASKGFSLPSVAETLTVSGTVNSQIRPESGYNYEFGGKFYLLNRHLFAQIAGYRMEIKDLLVATRVADDQYVGVNAGKTIHQGIEISVNYNWQIMDSFSISPYIAASFGEYRFVEFIDRDKNFSGNELTGVPKKTANAGVTLNSEIGLFVNADFRYVDKIPLNDLNSIYADAYQLLDLKSGYRFEIMRHLNTEIAGGVNNVTDAHYASLILPNATSFGQATPRYYYPGLPVNYYGTISVLYQF